MAKLRIAIQGCAHGELQNIYDLITKRYGDQMPDLLLILGDFQSLRGEEDLSSISVPPKYARLGDFQDYYSGLKIAPLPTIFIGGNHESMRQLMELPHGGFVARNIYYIGFSGSLIVRGVRISGLSGIYKPHDFLRKRPSLKDVQTDGWTRHVRSLYHVRDSDVSPLFMLPNVDIMMTHDWPQGIAFHGDIKTLLKRKPFFKKDIDSGRLGSPISWQLLRSITPHWWLSAHLHIKFEAEVSSGKRAREVQGSNPDEIDLDLDGLTKEKVHDESEPSIPAITRFLALDKCGRGRQHLELIEIDVDTAHPTYDPEALHLYADPEFLANVRFLEQQPPAKSFTNLDFLELRRQRGDLAEVNWNHYNLDRFADSTERQQTEKYRDLIEACECIKLST